MILKITAKNTNPIPTYPKSMISCPRIRRDIVNVAMFFVRRAMERAAGPE